jgi:tetratricopeptide (TPR) repeat protein
MSIQRALNKLLISRPAYWCWLTTALATTLCQAVLAITTPMLEGEILVREGKLAEGLSQLRTAIKAEDALRYDEPPGWILPMRHSLGANLMQAGRYAEAEEVYREDLARLPENGWSLYGLARSLELQHKNDEAAAVEARSTRSGPRTICRLPAPASASRGLESD